jgi:hypothetical protein
MIDLLIEGVVPDESNGKCNANAVGRLRAHLEIRRGRRERWISAAALRGREQSARVPRNGALAWLVQTLI